MAIPGFPDCVVEAAWPNAPFDASPTWSDITADVVAIKIKRGSAPVTTQVDPSWADIIVRNLGGAYDPTVSGHPNVNVGVRIRVRARWPAGTGTWYGRFDGYIDEFIEEWDEALMLPTMILRCADVLASLLARAAHDPTSYRALVLADGPGVYYRLGMGPGVTVIPDEVSAGASNPGSLGSIVLTAGAVPVSGAADADRDTGTSLGIVNSPQQRSFGSSVASVAAMSGVNAWTISGWIRSAQPPNSGQLQYVVNARGGSGLDYCFEMVADASGHLTIRQGTSNQLGTGASVNTNTDTTVNVCDGYWHHIEWTRWATGTATLLKIDGVTKINATWTALSYGAGGGVNTVLSWVLIGYPGYGGGGWTGDIDEIAMWGGTSTSFAPSTHAAAAFANARGRWINQRVSDRIALLCDLIGLPSARRNLPLASSTKLLAEPANIINTSVGALIRSAVLTEEGRLWVDGNGVLQVRARRTGAVSITVLFGPTVTPITGIPKVTLSRADVVNEVTIKAPNLKDVTAQNAASIAAYIARGLLPGSTSGSAITSISTELTTAADQLDMATRLVNLLGTPGAKVAPFHVSGASLANLGYWNYVLPIEPYDVVQVARPQVPAIGGFTRPPVVAEIESIEETITTDGTWDFVFSLRRPQQ